MNNNEAFSEQLASRVLKMMSSLLKIAGLPPLGNEITVFIGNYGWTPLGIHKDHTGENVLHFHLGFQVENKCIYGMMKRTKNL